jgi:hypothetical protein
MKHDQLTIVLVYGHNDGSSAIPSILHSMRELPGSRGLLISYQPPAKLPADIQWKQCGKVDYLQYSVFMMHALQAFIDTEYALIVQDDGWVLHGHNFTEDWYQYDYVGAPSHCGKVGDKFYLKFTWMQFADRLVVQNGGFSLRSKRFMQAPNHYGIVHMQAQEIHSWNEDAQLSCLMRPTFESLGFRYASESKAKDFSIEYLGPGFHDDFDLTRLVGHHAQCRRLVGDKQVRLTCNQPELDDIYGERKFLDYITQLGYEIRYADGSDYQTGTQAEDEAVPAGPQTRNLEEAIR